MLKEAQRKWIAYSDDACNFEDSLAFGVTATGDYLSSCLCALSYGRINDFDRIEQAILGRKKPRAPCKTSLNPLKNTVY